MSPSHPSSQSQRGRSPSPTFNHPSPQRPRPNMRRRPEPRHIDPATFASVAPTRTPTPAGIALFCGREYDSSELALDPAQEPTAAAPHPQFLPCPSPPPERPRKRQKRSNGCGAVVHSTGREAVRWRAPLAGVSPNVIPLERAYFTPGAATALNIHEDACGCAIRGVGCKICGNALGALDTPCVIHAEGRRRDELRYTFLPFAVSPPLPLPVYTPRTALADRAVPGSASSPALPPHPRPRGTRRRQATAAPHAPSLSAARSHVALTSAWDLFHSQLEPLDPDSGSLAVLTHRWEWLDDEGDFPLEPPPTTP
ncbi:hypothetical protein C8R46DRAFT_1136432 [Mycena filopes]|nr:hypothetical protein C8R46DRAFT_1136432 [Mycena filopes]